MRFASIIRRNFATRRARSRRWTRNSWPSARGRISAPSRSSARRRSTFRRRLSRSSGASSRCIAGKPPRLFNSPNGCAAWAIRNPPGSRSRASGGWMKAAARSRFAIISPARCSRSGGSMRRRGRPSAPCAAAGRASSSRAIRRTPRPAWKSARAISTSKPRAAWHAPKRCPRLAGAPMPTRSPSR